MLPHTICGLIGPASRTLVTLRTAACTPVPSRLQQRHLSGLRILLSAGAGLTARRRALSAADRLGIGGELASRRLDHLAGVRHVDPARARLLNLVNALDGAGLVLATRRQGAKVTRDTPGVGAPVRHPL
jgi:hypothetical protein